MDATEKWRERVRRLVASGSPVNEWCMRNGVRKSKMHQWLRLFRDEEPELLGGWEAAHAGDGRRNWYEAVRRANAAARAAEPPAFVEVAPAAPAPAAAGLTVDLRTLAAHVGPGAGEDEIAALLRAAMSL